MESRMHRAGVLILSGLVAVLGSAVSADAAASMMIIFYGGPLSRPVILDNCPENLSFMIATEEQVSIPDRELVDLRSQQNVKTSGVFRGVRRERR